MIIYFCFSRASGPLCAASRYSLASLDLLIRMSEWLRFRPCRGPPLLLMVFLVLTRPRAAAPSNLRLAIPLQFGSHGVDVLLHHSCIAFSSNAFSAYDAAVMAAASASSCVAFAASAASLARFAKISTIAAFFLFSCDKCHSCLLLSEGFCFCFGQQAVGLPLRLALEVLL